LRTRDCLLTIGVELGQMTPTMAEELGYGKDVRGVVITNVEPGSVADKAGLKQGMLVTRVEKEAVSTPAAARDALSKGSLPRGVLVQVQTARGGTNFILLRSSEG